MGVISMGVISMGVISMDEPRRRLGSNGMRWIALLGLVAADLQGESFLGRGGAGPIHA